jgi:hypothetical protein
MEIIITPLATFIAIILFILAKGWKDNNNNNNNDTGLGF